MKLNLALEWFLNPDHLPFLVGIDKGLYKQHHIDLEVIEPKEHYDGFDELNKGKVELATNEPLHLIEKYRENICSLGNFFETQGGIIFTEEGYRKFTEGEQFQITSPVSNPVTDRIAIDILKRHIHQKDRVFSEQNCKIVVKDFYHIKNLQAGMDAAWLCFENFEGVEAEFENLPIHRIYLEDVAIPNFCALDLFVSRSFFEKNENLILDFKEITEKCVELLKEDCEYCKTVFYGQSKQERSPLMDGIIQNSFRRFLAPMEASKTKWWKLYEYTKERGITELNADQYERLFI